MTSINELIHQLQVLQPFLQNIQHLLEKSKQEISQASVEKAKTEDELLNLRKTNEDLLKQLLKKEDSFQELNAKLVRLKNAETKLARENIELLQTIEDLQTENKITKRELDRQTRGANRNENVNTPEQENKADLSDENRPTKIAEKYSELYDNEWTDAYEEFEKLGHDEKTIISYLLSILKLTKRQCDIISERNSDGITKAVYHTKQMPSSVHQEIKKQIIYMRKVAAPFITNQVVQEVFKYLSDKTRDPVELAVINTNALQAYIKKCTEICWLMVVQDPPLYFSIDVTENDEFDKSRFKEYTRTGSRVEYLVWPDLYLKEGSRLCKGVAQGCGDQTEKKKNVPAASQAHVSLPRDIKPTDCLMDHQITHTGYQADAENTDRTLSGHDNTYEQITANSHQTGIYPNLSRSVHVPSVTTQYQEEKVAVKIRRADFYENVPRGVPQEYWVHFVYDCDVYGIESSITKATAGQYYRACVKHYQNVRYLAAIK